LSSRVVAEVVDQLEAAKAVAAVQAASVLARDCPSQQELIILLPLALAAHLVALPIYQVAPGMTLYSAPLLLPAAVAVVVLVPVGLAAMETTAVPAVAAVVSCLQTELVAQETRPLFLPAKAITVEMQTVLAVAVAEHRRQVLMRPAPQQIPEALAAMAPHLLFLAVL
jgi:hypothetical protein